MIFLPPVSCIIMARDIILPIGWFASAFLGFWAACYLDRRRSINAVQSQIEIIKDMIAESEDGEASYKATFDDLKKAVFTSIPLFSKPRQKEIIQAWAAYRSLDFSQMRDVDFVSSVMHRLGHPITFKHKAVLAALDEIERHIR